MHFKLRTFLILEFFDILRFAKVRKSHEQRATFEELKPRLLFAKRKSFWKFPNFESAFKTRGRRKRWPHSVSEKENPSCAGAPASAVLACAEFFILGFSTVILNGALKPLRCVRIKAHVEIAHPHYTLSFSELDSQFQSMCF